METNASEIGRLMREERKKKGIKAPREFDGYLKRYAKMVTSSNTGAVFAD